MDTKAKKNDEAIPAQMPADMTVEQKGEPRTGACTACLRKHLLKALGYAEEVEEDDARGWERDRLLMNLMLAEDHCAELGDAERRKALRSARIAIEEGAAPVALVKPLLADKRIVAAKAAII